MLAAVGYSFWRGRSPERIVALAFLVGTAATALLPGNDGSQFARLYKGGLLVDSVLMVVLICIALRANRFWPIWIASLQLASVAVHVAKLYDPGVLPVVYWWVDSKIAWPMVAILMVGTLRAGRRAQLYGRIADWSHLRW